MSIRKQDVCPLVLYYLGYSMLRNLGFRLRREAMTRFVTFHDIPAAAVEDFRRKILYLKSSTNVVSLDDYFAGRLSQSRINVVVTFDDGYKSWASTAVPILKE